MNTRRILTIALVFLLGACDYFSGAWTHQPEELKGNLSAQAQALLDRAARDIPAAGLRDHHTHVLGIGDGAWVNPRSLSWLFPIERIKTSTFLSASGITDEALASEQYTDRLVRLIRNFPNPGKHYILGFDYNHGPGCAANKSKSTFSISNDYVTKLATRFPDIFIPAVSVHPYRTDAVERIEYWAKRGVKMVKWLPNSMGINACDRRLKDYYCALKRNGMVLNTHTGEEQAVKADDAQALGNPLLLRYPLDLGVKVIMAHSASLGEDADLDAPGETATSFDLFMRMMDDPQYKDNLLGDISATTQYNRLRFDGRESGPLLELLRRTDLHGRLVNGSDYPLPAINWITHLGKIEDLGMITNGETKSLQEIYDFNPLLFDFALKRTVRHPKTGKGFPPSVFLANKLLGPEWTPNDTAAYKPPTPPKRCPIRAMPTMGKVWALCGKKYGTARHNDKCE